jgi:hypothetical protein
VETEGQPPTLIHQAKATQNQQSCHFYESSTSLDGLGTFIVAKDNRTILLCRCHDRSPTFDGLLGICFVILFFIFSNFPFSGFCFLNLTDQIFYQFSLLISSFLPSHEIDQPSLISLL